MRFLLKYPTRSRPELFRKRVRNWSTLASGRHDIHWLCSFHADDPTMQTEEIQRFCDDHQLEVFISDVHTKVANFNAGIAECKAPWDVLILISDDMAAQEQDWDDTIARDFGDNLDQGLWYDVGMNPQLNTLSIMGRPIFDWLGFAYHPAFESVYCDDHYQRTLEHAGKLKPVKRSSLLFRHEWKVENDDALMRQTEDRSVYARDRMTLNKLINEKVA